MLEVIRNSIAEQEALCNRLDEQIHALIQQRNKEGKRLDSLLQSESALEQLEEDAAKHSQN